MLTALMAPAAPPTRKKFRRLTSAMRCSISPARYLDNVNNYWHLYNKTVALSSSYRRGAMDSAPRSRLGHDERRRQLLEIAIQQFRDGHYGSVSIETVADAAGVTRGLVHHYFRNKHDLYVAVIREMFRDSEVQVPEYVQGTTPEQRLAESVENWLEMVSRTRATWLVALDSGLGRDPEVTAILDRVRERAVDNIIAILGIGPASEVSPAARGAIRAYGAFAEASTREWLERDRFDRAQLGALLTDTLLHLVSETLPAIEGR
jgi:AcrR family transcriptional regulator